jgi:hypothetical protein
MSAEDVQQRVAWASQVQALEAAAGRASRVRLAQQVKAAPAEEAAAAAAKAA